MAAQGVVAPRGRAIPPLSSLLAVAFTLLVIAWPILFATPGGTLLAAVYALPGLVLALRRPGQPLSWLLMLIALGIALGTTVPTASLDALLAGEADALGQFTAWTATTGWVFVFSGFVGILLTFPAGTLAGGRWRAVSFVTIAAYVVIAVLLLFGPTIEVTPEQSASVYLPNPFALPLPVPAQVAIPTPSNLYPLLLAGLFVALLVMAARWRRSTGLERLQYRWLWWAVVVVVLGTVAWAFVVFVLEVEFVLLAGVIIGLTYPAIPIAVVVAVLRYRLYEIDRLVSRTLGWALATAAIRGGGAGVRRPAQRPRAGAGRGDGRRDAARVRAVPARPHPAPADRRSPVRPPTDRGRADAPAARRAARPRGGARGDRARRPRDRGRHGATRLRVPLDPPAGSPRIGRSARRGRRPSRPDRACSNGRKAVDADPWPCARSCQR